MKNFLMSFTLASLLVFGLSSASSASAEPCARITIVCSNGNGTNLETCGSAEQIANDVAIVYDALCN